MPSTYTPNSINVFIATNVPLLVYSKSNSNTLIPAYIHLISLSPSPHDSPSPS